MNPEAEDLTCRELADFLADYLAGELQRNERSLFELHLAECPECVAYVRSYAETVSLAKDAYASEPEPALVPQRLVRAVLDARARSDLGARRAEALAAAPPKRKDPR